MTKKSSTSTKKNSSKPKVKANTSVNDVVMQCGVIDPMMGNAMNVKTELQADEEIFIPKYPENSSCAELRANIPLDTNTNQRKILMPHRATLMVDCGVNIKVPSGYKAVITSVEEQASKGLIITNAPIVVEDGRISVMVSNIGKQIIAIEHGNVIAKMYLEPIYMFDWTI